MAVRSNLTGFTVNAAVIPYKVASGVTVGRGDPIRLVEDSTEHVMKITNIIEEYAVEGIARTAGESGDTIPCHIFKYYNTYGDMKPYTYGQFKIFTYDDLKRTYFPEYL